MKLRLLLLAGTLTALACATGAKTDFTKNDDDDDSTTTSSGQGGTGTGGTGTGLTGGSSSGQGATGGSSSGQGGSGGGGCPDGYEPEGNGCVDIDECADGTDDCDALAGCINDEPGFHCGSCPNGYADTNSDGTQCDDIDECAEGTDNCDPLAGCLNDEPGFHCDSCPNGYTDTNGDGTLCTPNAAVIGLDDRHGYDASSSLGTGSMHAQFRTAITNLGMTYVVLNSMTAANLSGLNALWVQQPYDSNSSPISSTEISAIVAFVNGGGGLVMIGDGGSGGNQTNLNQLAQNWGVTFSSSSQWGSGLAISQLASHAVTAGVSSYGIDYAPAQSSVNAPSIRLNTTGDVVLSAATGSGNAGNVVSISDSCFNNSSTADYNINSLNNAELLDNILGFTTQ